VIKRDEFGIIVQHNLDHPEQMDGGDSASRTGIMAMCGSIQDWDLLSKFLVETDVKKWPYLVRHPEQKKWNDPKETSRDQLICWAAGGGSRGFYLFAIQTLIAYAESWTINKDVLLPHVRFALYKAARYPAPLWIRLLAKPMMTAHLIWATKINPDDEQNQNVCLCSIYGDEWLKRLRDWHPNLYGNLIRYWAGKPWRDQKEISEAMIKFIHGKLK
jgi:hypothetical protein